MYAGMGCAIFGGAFFGQEINFIFFFVRSQMDINF